MNISRMPLCLLVLCAGLCSCVGDKRSEPYASSYTIQTYDQLLGMATLVTVSATGSRSSEKHEGLSLFSYPITEKVKEVRSNRVTAFRFENILIQWKGRCDTSTRTELDCPDQSADAGVVDECVEVTRTHNPCPFGEEHYFPEPGRLQLVFSRLTADGTAEVEIVADVVEGEADMSFIGGPILIVDELDSLESDIRFQR